MRKAKTFDCIAFKRQAQARIYEETKHMTGDEFLNYFRRKVDESPWAERFAEARRLKKAS